MDPGNDFYGHRRVLSEYVFGEPEHAVIWGYVQHGWNLASGIPPEQPVRLRMPQFVWNAENADKARAAARSRVVPIGAPFVYLAQGRSPVQPEPGTTLMYPFHAWEGDDAVGSHTDLVDEIRNELGTDITTCLYWYEYQQPEVRRIYEAAGFRVICHGHRDGDPEFLYRQIAEIERHETVVTNRVATAIWYGGLLGRTVRIVGTGFGIGTDDEGRWFAAEARRRWPGLFEGGVTGEAAVELASRELGAEFLMSRHDLAAALGWTGWRRTAGPVLSGALSVKRRLGSSRR